MLDEYVCFLHQKRLIAEFSVVTAGIYMLTVWHTRTAHFCQLQDYEVS